MPEDPTFMWQRQENHEFQASLDNILKPCPLVKLKNVFVTEFYNIEEMSWSIWGYSYLHQNLPNHKLWYSHQRLGNLDQHREGSWRQISLEIVTRVLAPGKPTRVDKAQSSPLHRKSALLVPGWEETAPLHFGDRQVPSYSEGVSVAVWRWIQLLSKILLTEAPQ